MPIGSILMGNDHVNNDVDNKQDVDLVDEEHIINEVEVNMEGFRFSVDKDGVTKTSNEPLHLEVNVTKNDLEVLDFDSFDSAISDDSNSARKLAFRKLKIQGKQAATQSSIKNYFFIRHEFSNKEDAK
nr:transposase, mutator type [Tanacetum cinerariifolium]